MPCPLLGGGAAGRQEFPSVSELGSGLRGSPVLPENATHLSQPRARGYRGNSAASERAALSITLRAGYNRLERELGGVNETRCFPSEELAWGVR